jgi:glycine oxidase
MAEQLQKNSQASFDFFVVGQGIAGSILSLSLIEAGFSVCVIDNSKLSSCSSVAAGIWNPVVFKRLAKSWLADEIVPELLRFYSHFETVFGAKLIAKRKIIKPFTELQEKEFWLKKAVSENKYLENKMYSNYTLSNNQVIDSYSKVLEAGNLNVIEFLSQTKKYISEHFNYLDETFSFNELKNQDHDGIYKNISFKNIIFCEGHLISNNPFFNWIPTKPAKGEVLIIKCNELILENDILNKGIFIMPLGNSMFKVGATYQWDKLDDLPTTDKLIELETRLKQVINCPYVVVKHEAGIRPSVIDRRPVVGVHPKHENMFVFNGFGTKAVMLAPYFSKQLVNSIKSKSIIMAEVSPTRFIK